MDEYAVAWRDSAEPYTLYVGGLAIDPSGLRLRGSAGYEPVVRKLAPGAIEAVRPARRKEHLGGFPSLRLELGGGRTLLLASVMGIGALSELIDALTRVAGL